MIIQEILDEAKRRVMPLGVKPEDYYRVDGKIPFRIAKLIVDEYFHLLNLHKMNKVTT